MMTPAPLLITFLGILTFQATAFAQATSETVEENRLTQLATLRSTLTNQLHLQAYELIDEMVYEWKERPLFEQPTEVVVASVNAPIGYGAGLMTLWRITSTRLFLKTRTPISTWSSAQLVPIWWCIRGEATSSHAALINPGL